MEKILSHEWSKVGDIFVVKVEDLEEGHLYQMQASREMVASHPEMDGPETWSVLNRGPRGRPPYMYNKGMSVRSKMSVLANLDVSGYPCDNGRNPVQGFAWNAFHNDEIVLLYGLEASLVRFWNTAATTETKATEAQCKPITPSTWAQPLVATSFEVRTPASERALHAQVVAGLFGPYKNWRRAADPNFVGNVYRAEYVQAHSSILAHEFAMLGTVIVSAHPNSIKRDALLKAEDQSLTEQNRAVMAGTKLGSTDFISAIIAEDERLMAPPVSSQKRSISSTCQTLMNRHPVNAWTESSNGPRQWTRTKKRSSLPSLIPLRDGTRPRAGAFGTMDIPMNTGARMCNPRTPSPFRFGQ